MKNIFKDKFSRINRKPLIQINGTDEVLAEGCGEVKLYDETKIIFKSERNVIIEGEKLIMTNLENGAVAVSGRISFVKFED